MKKVKLLKDLPGVKAGTFATQDGNFWDFIRDGMTLSFNDQELKDHPDWFEILPDRIELFWTTEDHRCLCLYDRSEITEEQRVLMEQAINGELFSEEQIKTVFNEYFDYNKDEDDFINRLKQKYQK